MVLPDSYPLDFELGTSRSRLHQILVALEIQDSCLSLEEGKKEYRPHKILTKKIYI